MSLRLFNDAEVQDFVVLLVDEVREVLHHIFLLVVRGDGQRMTWVLGGDKTGTDFWG